MEHKRKRSSISIHSSLIPLLQCIKVFIMPNSTPVRTRRSNTVNERIKDNDSHNKHMLRRCKSYTDISSSHYVDTQQSWSQATKLYTLCLEPLDGPQYSVSPKYMQKHHYENWWSQTPTLQSMA